MVIECGLWRMKVENVAGGVLVELPLGDAPNFNLEKAVCSHGLFMMAPNHWHSPSKTLKRPLRLHGDASFMVHISHQSHHALHIHVLGTRSLSPHQHQSLLSQVKRMLRLSEEENKRVTEFREIHEESKLRGFGRVFRSPTLFEDMVKCILLCNCQWSRTLSMAQALCELQSELQHPSTTKLDHLLAPKTPVKKESKRKSEVEKHSTSLTKLTAAVASTDDLHPSEVAENITIMGNFPSPEELASLDENFLASYCNLGYRARRVINLSRRIVEGQIRLDEFEDAGDVLSLSDYNRLFEKLRLIDGFGPFTCANVLMCMGFYHVIPTDSETIRHLKQVHAKRSTIKTVEEDVEDIYGIYAPFQFLVYWSEVWHFYEEWFGNLSEMPHSNYRLITAANMKPKKPKQGRSKKAKLGP